MNLFCEDGKIPMTFKQFVRNIIIGKDRYIPSHSIFKTTILRGYFSFLLFFTALVYLAIDTLHGVYGNTFVYLFLFLTAIVSFLLNRKGKMIVSTSILLIVTNFVVYLYASAYRTDNGIMLFFITTGLFACGLFEYRQKAWWIGFNLFSYLLFLLAYFYDFSLLEKTGFTEVLVAGNYAVNFTMAFAIAVLLLFFLLNLNHHAEKTLQENEANLIHTTDELKKSRQRFELAIKGSNSGIWEWNVAHNLVYNSAVWKAMLGYGEDELPSLTVEGFLEMVHPDDRQRVGQALDDHLTKQHPYKCEFRMIKKDGSVFWVADSGVALLDAQGMTVQMVGSIIDITERKEAEQKIILQNELLAKTNAELDRFVYSTSHDLRSPLSSLLGLINIAEKTADPGEVLACMGMMKDRIRTLETFIKEIIDYSRNTRVNVNSEPVKIFPLVIEVVENLRYSEGAENIFVKYNIPPELNIRTDENRIKVVLNNLIGNCIKYYDSTKEDPYISVKVILDDNQLTICIEDNGIGIEQEHQSRIFDMFYRASEKSKGSGLGLYIVKETISKLGGTIGVTSVAGHGTSFEIRLPVQQSFSGIEVSQN
jgi:PAS domain S-box-containing protein